MTLAKLTKQLEELSDSSAAEISNEERQALMAACQKAKLTLENPLEATVRIMFGAFESVALCLGVNMKLLDLGVDAEGPITAEQLASRSGADQLLVVRIMRLLVAMDIFKEVGHQVYVAGPLAKVWVTGSPLREVVIHIGSHLPPVTSLPEYFEEKGYRNPTDAEDGPFQFAHQSKEHFFDWLNKRPKIQSAFNTTMRIARDQRGEEWFEFYPVAKKLRLSDSDPSAILLVDIGGNVGHDLIRFQKKFPDSLGRLVFEDLPTVVDSAVNRPGGVPEGIEGVGHDFFQAHPPALRNSKAYYLRNILHDWPDKQARQILENVREIMAGDSILLIDENALPDDHVALYQAELDLIMMGMFASLDRTAAQFEELLDSAGFKLTGIWKPRDYVPGSGTLFEAMLKE